MNAYPIRQSGSMASRPRTYDACMRRHVHGPIRPMHTPTLLERLFRIH